MNTVALSFLILLPAMFTPSHSEADRTKAQFPPNLAQIQKNDPIWQNALKEVYKSAAELRAQRAGDLRRGVKMDILSEGDPTLKDIALTFDDGPHPIYTERLLKILEQEKVTATFFVVGKMVSRYPDLARMIVQKGHMLANHTFSHVTLTKIPNLQIRAEYRACNDVVYRATGVRMQFCRPPGGDYDRRVVEDTRLEGLTTVLWTADPGDFLRLKPAVIKEKVLADLESGGIILLHDGIEETLQALPKIIHYAKKQGYRFVSVRQLAADRNAASARRVERQKVNSPVS